MNLSKQYLILFLILSSIFSNAEGLYADTLCLKTDSFISFAADSVDFPSFTKMPEPEKNCCPYIMARIEKYGLQDTEANRMVRLLSETKQIDYNSPSIIRLIYRYEDCPAVRRSKQTFVKKAFDRRDRYNVWTGEGSESEVSMMRTSGYLFAQKALLYGSFFKNVPERLAEMKGWIMDWSSRVYEVGTAEFNSSSSNVYSIIGWLNLYDFAEDEEVKLAAKAVLDYYATEMALHNNLGFTGGSEMNGTFIEDQEKTASFFYNWFWYDSDQDTCDFTGNNFLQLIYAVTSDYRPPSLLAKYAKFTPVEPGFYFTSKPSYLLDKESFNKQMYYRTSNYSLGCLYSSYGGWTDNSSQIVNWKLLVRNDKKVSEVRGNGPFWNNYSGMGKDPWTQFAQYENILIQLTKVPENAQQKYNQIDGLCKVWNKRWKKDYKKRFADEVSKKNIYSSAKNIRFDNESYLIFPGDVEFSDTDGTWFVNFGSVYMSILGVPAHQPTYLRSYSDKQLLVINNDPGKVCGFVIELFNADGYASYDEFKEEFIRHHIMYLDAGRDLLTYESPKEKHVEMLFRNDGIFEEPIVDWGYGVVEQTVNIHRAGFEQPDWSEFDDSGRLPVLLADNKQYNFEEVWPVMSGPSINLDNSILKVEFEGESYIVDYSGEIPVFLD